VNAFSYYEITGAVLYVSVVTRMDISFAVGVLTRHMKSPTYEACIAASHTDIKYYWLRDKITDGIIAMVHVSTTDQRADILTKVVDSSVFHRHVASLMSDVP
jgi:hypothetical protein